MKNKIIYVTLIAMLLSACFADKGNYEYAESEVITVTGIEPSYNKISLVDKISIVPVVSSNKPDANFTYFWGIYETNVQGVAPKLDTICKTKEIDYLILQQAKGWVLVFGAKNTKTGFTRYVTSNINVITQFTRGWYVLKSESGYSDLDLFLTPTTIIPEGKLENVYNLANGFKLKGKASSLGFYSDYKSLQGDKYLNTRAMFLTTDEDASVIDINTIKEIRNFNSLFYSPPSIKKPTILCLGAQALYFVNDGKIHGIYSMSSNSGQFGVPQMVDAYNSPYRLSKYYYTSYFSNPLIFDEVSSTFFNTGASALQLSQISDAATTSMPSKNNNKTLLFMGYKTMFDTYAVFQDKTNPSLKILSTITPDFSAFNMVNDTLLASSKIFNANLYTLLDGDENMIYFTVGNQVWSRNLSNKFEQQQYTVPSDETITFIRHRKYTSESIYAYNYFIVGTKKGSNYNVRMFTKTSGNLNATPAFILSGKGEPSDVIYISPSVSTYTYSNSL